MTTMLPVCLKSRGVEHWFAWRSVRDPKGAIVRAADRAFVAESLPALTERWQASHPGVAIDDEPSTIDLDALIANLRGGSSMDAEALLNALNMLDDVAHACRATGRDASFGGIAARLTLYDKAFSLTSVGRMVGAPPDTIFDADRRALAEWLDIGADMVRGVAGL
ncbi:MAG: hypothetical protein E6Q50_13445 [Lysobacter sp.]|nr:MAG: hypothetical protein E6Q50_13445 [Lysobacter sp.]